MFGTILKQIYQKETKETNISLAYEYIKSYAKQKIFSNVFKSLLIFTKYVNVVLYMILLGNNISQNIYACFQIVFLLYKISNE